MATKHSSAYFDRLAKSSVFTFQAFGFLSLAVFHLYCVVLAIFASVHGFVDLPILEVVSYLLISVTIVVLFLISSFQLLRHELKSRSMLVSTLLLGISHQIWLLVGWSFEVLWMSFMIQLLFLLEVILLGMVVTSDKVKMMVAINTPKTIST